MFCEYNGIMIRDAKPEDAALLCGWWNDGAVMAHAGFPNGLGITVAEAENHIKNGAEIGRNRIHVIMINGVAIGEMNYRGVGNGVCEIGIKICEADYQNKGLGKIILSIFIDELFNKLGYEKIVLDANLTNTRAQHVYERLGFRGVGTNINSWKDQLGNPQSSVDYELTKRDFVSYLK